MSEDQFVVNDPDFNIDYTKHSVEAVVQVFLPSNRFIALMETELRLRLSTFSRQIDVKWKKCIVHEWF